MSSKLGISPLLATVLLVAATVVISTMLAGWVSSTTSATQNTVSNRTTEGVACTATEIVIDDVYTGAGSGSIARAIVRNSGGSDNLAITSAQLYDKFGNNFTTVNALPSSLNKGQMATLNFNYSILPTTTNDSAHGVNNGTLTNTPLFTLNGKYGSAMSFVDADDYIDTGMTALTHNFTNNITIGAWVYPKYFGDYRTIVTSINGNGGTASNRLMISGAVGGGQILAQITFQGTETNFFSNSNVPDNQWTHIAFTYDGSNEKVYIGGIFDSNKTETRNISGSTNPMRISQGIATYRFNGTIDDVAIWNRSLTNAEINTSMNYGPSYVSNTNDLVAYWKFDEGKGILSCPSDFSRVVVTTNCGGVSAEFTKPSKC